MSTNVLYDAPGPRTRRMTLIFSIIATVLVAIGAYFLIYRPMQERGQLTMALWGPIIDPGNQSFGQLWDRMAEGWIATFKAALLAMAFSFIAGTAIAVARAQLRATRGRRYRERGPVTAFVMRWLVFGGNLGSRFWVEFFRGLPVIVTIFFVYKALPEYGLSIENPMWYLVIGLTLYNSVVIGEILRSGMDGLPRGQQEAASAVGLTAGQSIRLVLLPQSFRIMLPALISQAVVVFKDTSLGGLIVGYEEALRVARGIVEVLYNPIPMYLMIGFQYILVCYALSKLAQYFERRSRRSGLPTAPKVTTDLDTGRVL